MAKINADWSYWTKDISIYKIKDILTIMAASYLSYQNHKQLFAITEATYFQVYRNRVLAVMEVIQNFVRYKPFTGHNVELKEVCMCVCVCVCMCVCACVFVCVFISFHFKDFS